MVIWMAKTILCDLDSILADILTPWLRSYNRDYSDTLTVDRIPSWDFHNIVKPECGTKIYDYLREPGFFENLKPLPGAIEAVQALRSAGHDFLVLTAGADVEDAATQKVRWCKRYLDLSPKQVIVTPRKELVRGDVLIDDSPEQIKKYRGAWGQAPLILTISYPYNECVRGDCWRFKGWDDTADSWFMMTEWIASFERNREPHKVLA